MNIEPDKIYTVFHSLWYKGKNEGIFTTDLQFDGNKCYLIFEWAMNFHRKHPLFRHEISPKLLVPTPSAAHDFLIEMPVEIPENPVLTKLIQEAKSRKQI